MTETIGQSVPNFNDSAFFPMVFNGLVSLRTTVFGTVRLSFDVFWHGFRYGSSRRFRFYVSARAGAYNLD
jgi:hypothetical protein